MNLYQILFDLINSNIFGSALIQGTAEYTVTCLFALSATFILLALPLILVFKVINMFLR